MLNTKPPVRTKAIDRIFLKLGEKDLEILTAYITKMLLHQMNQRYKEQQKNNNPLSI